VVSCACDCPFLPLDLVSRLVGAAERANVPIAVAASGARHHPVVAAWRSDLPLDADDILRTRGLRKVDDVIESFANVRVEFSAEPIDPFFNINTPQDLSRAEALIQEEVHSHA
jgi:molybdopterin-guanine dinucleotide biosynthesis protein A